MTPLALEALSYLDRGWPIVPSRGDKKSPCVKWTVHQTQLPTQKQIFSWDQKWSPERWGVVTGSLAGIVVVDFDGDKGKEWMIKWGLDPHVRSGSGGYHVYFEHPGWLVPTMNSRSSDEWPFPGVDVRGDGGFIVLLGSNKNGPYEIVRPISPYPSDELPDELRIYLQEKSKTFKVIEEVIDEEQPTPFEVNTASIDKPNGRVDGGRLVQAALGRPSSNGRNNGGFWLAGQLRDNHFSESEAWTWMSDYSRRVPTTNARGEREAYTESEARASLSSAYSQAPRDPSYQRRPSPPFSPPNTTPPDQEPEIDHDSHLLALCDEIIESKQSHRIYEAALFNLISKADKHIGIQVRTKLRKEFGKDMVLTGDGSWPELYREAMSVRRVKTPVLQDDPPEGSMVEIQTSNRQLRDISTESIKQIQSKNNPPSLFVRSGSLVHVIQDEKERPSVSIVTESRLRGVLARTANFMKLDRFGELKNAYPPIEVVKDVMAFNPQSWPFPQLSSVAEVPVLRPDGTILDQPGYDSESTIFYAPASTLKSFPLPEFPTQEDVMAARAIVEEAIGEFPYADQASHANIYGLLLTPVLRPAISGCAPLAVVDAPQAGTGKSLLIDVLSVITTGRPAAMMPYPYKEEEMQKQIAASLSAGRQLIVFDNLEGELRSPALALAITAKEFEARILGVSRNMTVENTSTWVVTGNNIRPAGDMPRRCYQIRLNAQDSRPYTGRTFKHPELLGWVSENRSQILHALLIIARYWFSQGSPCHVPSTVGSFEHWHRVVGSIVAHARIPGFLANYSTFIEQEDESPRQWEGFLAGMFGIYLSTKDPNKSRPFLISEVLDRLQIENSELHQIAPNEIADCLERKGNHRISVGKMFRFRRERRFGYGEWQYWLQRDTEDTEHKGSAVWCIAREKRVEQISQ